MGRIKLMLLPFAASSLGCTKRVSGLHRLKTEAPFRIIPVLSFIVTLLKGSLLK